MGLGYWISFAFAIGFGILLGTILIELAWIIFGGALLLCELIFDWVRQKIDKRKDDGGPVYWYNPETDESFVTRRGRHVNHK